MNWRSILISVLVFLGVLAILPIIAPSNEPVISSWSGGAGSGSSAPIIRGAAERQPAADVSQASAAINSYLGGLAAAGQWSGAALVAKQGTVILAKGYGAANTGGTTPNTPETRFRLASITKQFTAMAVLQLVAQNRIKLDGPVCHYLADCPAAWSAITIRHLLTHTSGLPNFTDFGSYELTMAQPTTPEALVGRFRDEPLWSTPGSAYRYGNSGYVLLGYVVERVSGQSYSNYLRDHIFAPLGMNDSGYDLDASGIAQGFAAPGVPCAVLNATTLYSAGGLYSSVRDMYRWDQALYTPVLLPDDLRAQLFTPQVGSYGFGWMITQRGGQRTIEHPGLMSGAATHIARQPESGITVIVLSNLESANVEAMTSQLITLAQSS